MTYPELVGAAVLGLSAAVSGVAVTLRARGPVAGVSMALGGVAVFFGALLVKTGGSDVAPVLFTAGGALLLPLAVTAYPQLKWRHPVDFVALVVVLGCGALALASQATTEDEGTQTLWAAGLTLGVACFLHTWWKLERSEGDERRALVWMSLSLAVVGIVFFFTVFALDGGTGRGVGTGLAFGGCYALMGVVAPAMYVGLRRPEIVDVRGLVVRASVLLTAIVAYMAVYATIEGVLVILGDSRPSVGTMALAAALAAAMFHPLQVAMRGTIDRLLFGIRPDPLDAAGHVAERIGDDPSEALRAIREALVLPYAQVVLDGRGVASSGAHVAHTRSFPLPLGDGRAGQLVVGLRPGDLALTAGDVHVINLAVPLLAQSLRAQLLAEDLQESREATITALEEERRRLRRDLHDGLGPRLSGIAFTSDAARNTMAADPEAAGELLRSLRAETVAAIQEIRQLVYGMRPPALDELGLVPAIRQKAATLQTPDGRPMRVVVEAGELPPLTAAVEVAAYRITVEALTNAARHSGSDEARASLAAADGSLVVEVCDRGSSPGSWSAGVGLSSMQERAAELGGTLEAGYADGGGRVRAVLPF